MRGECKSCKFIIIFNTRVLNARVTYAAYIYTATVFINVPLRFRAGHIFSSSFYCATHNTRTPQVAEVGFSRPFKSFARPPSSDVGRVPSPLYRGTRTHNTHRYSTNDYKSFAGYSDTCVFAHKLVYTYIRTYINILFIRIT